MKDNGIKPLQKLYRAGALIKIIGDRLGCGVAVCCYSRLFFLVGAVRGSVVVGSGYGFYDGTRTETDRVSDHYAALTVPTTRTILHSKRGWHNGSITFNPQQ